MKAQQSSEENPTTLQIKIKEIEDSKFNQMLLISDFFGEVRKKMNKVIDKCQKSIQVKVSELYSEASSILKKVDDCQELSQIEEYQYLRRADRFLESIQQINVKDELSTLSQLLKPVQEQIKKVDILKKAERILIQDDIIRYDTYQKVDIQEPVRKLVKINGKLMKVCEGSLCMDRHHLDKKVDLLTIVKFKRKEKKMIICLHEGIIGIYNDKLILHSHKQLKYTADKLVEMVQVGEYLFIVEQHCIYRISLCNLNEMKEEIYTFQIKAITNEMYNGGVVLSVYEDNRFVLVYLNLDLTPYHQSSSLNCVYYQLRVVGEMLVCLGSGGVRVYRGINSSYNYWNYEDSPLSVIPIMQDSFVVVTKNSHFILFEINPTQPSHRFIASNLFTKSIISVTHSNNHIYCLAESGRKFYLYHY